MANDRRVANELMDSLVGRQIKRAEVWADPEAGWSEHEYARLHLDDGRVIEFHAWGYDAWGMNVEAVELVDVSECRSCGEPHPGARVFVSQDPWAPQPTTYAFCSDGNSIAWVGAAKC